MTKPVIVQYALTPNARNFPVLVNFANDFISAKLRKMGDSSWYDGHYWPFGESVKHFRTEALGLQIIKRYEYVINGHNTIIWAKDSDHCQSIIWSKYGVNAKAYPTFMLEGAIRTS